MFNWHTCLGMMLFLLFLILGVGLIASGFYLICETGNAWGFGLIVAACVLGGGVWAGFGL